MYYWLLKRCGQIIGVIWLVSVTIFPLSAVAADVSQGYHASESMTAGNLVATTGNDNQIALATTTNTDNLVGIVIAANSSLLSVNVTGSTLQVATGGLANGFVDDLNGEVKKGDPITVSPLSGVGMKATIPGRIVGIAQADFAAATGVQTKQLTDKRGTTKSAKVGLVPILVSVGSFQPTNYTGTSAVVRGVQTVASNLTGRTVSAPRAFGAFAVIVLAIILAVVVLYSSVTGSIRSIGRNPLAKKPVLRSLLQVVIAVSIIVVAAFAAVYVIVGV